MGTLPSPPVPAQGSPVGLWADQVAKSHAGMPVFAGVSLRVAPGECVAILGESGVGKSTLLNCLAGLDTIDHGTIHLMGRDWASLTEREAAAWRRQHLGFVFQAFHVLPHLTVAQNVGLPLMLLGVSDPDRVDALLAAVGLAGLHNRLPQTLSGGQLQRVAIARALVHRPRVILADEPTGNLDPATAHQVMTLLATQTRHEGAALVLVTHSQAAAAMAERQLVLTSSGMVSG